MADDLTRKADRCPFCGSALITGRGIRDGYSVSCRCGASIVAYNGKTPAWEVALEKWNKRFGGELEAERTARENAERCLRDKDAAMDKLFNLLSENRIDYSHLLN